MTGILTVVDPGGILKGMIPKTTFEPTSHKYNTSHATKGLDKTLSQTFLPLFVRIRRRFRTNAVLIEEIQHLSRDID